MRSNLAEAAPAAVDMDVPSRGRGPDGSAPAAVAPLPDAATLVEELAPMVRREVHRVAMRVPREVDREDLYHAGIVGLLEAVERFDPSRGIVFEGFARMRVRGAILDSLRGLDHLPRRVRTRIKKISKARDQLAEQGERAPSDARVAEELGLTAEQVQRARSSAGGQVSMDPQLLDRLDLSSAQAPRGGCLQALERREAMQLAVTHLRALGPRDRLALGLYYEGGLTLKEIGGLLGVTESRIGQILRKALDRVSAAVARQHEVRA